MVGLIITFPTLVSSGLDKETVIDADKVLMEMQSQPKYSGQSANDGTPGSGDADNTKSEKEDPMKSMMESLKEDQAKKR
jgi:hypothetical protein